MSEPVGFLGRLGHGHLGEVGQDHGFRGAAVARRQDLEDEEADDRQQDDRGHPGHPDPWAGALVLVADVIDGARPRRHRPASGIGVGRVRDRRGVRLRDARDHRRIGGGAQGRGSDNGRARGTRAAPAAPAAAGACPVASQPSSASANEAAELQRFAGSSASARWTIAASSSGTDGRTVRGSGVGPLSRAIATAAALSPSQGRCPVSISKSTMPSEKMSPASVVVSPRACSGLK